MIEDLLAMFHPLWMPLPGGTRRYFPAPSASTRVKVCPNLPGERLDAPKYCSYCEMWTFFWFLTLRWVWPLPEKHNFEILVHLVTTWVPTRVGSHGNVVTVLTLLCGRHGLDYKQGHSKFAIMWSDHRGQTQPCKENEELYNLNAHNNQCQNCR